MSGAERTQSPITHLGHVGIFVNDLETMTHFYTEVLDFTITDGSLEEGLIFLSSRPDFEHHMLLLVPGRTSRNEKWIQQISFAVDSLSAVLNYRARLADYGATIDSELSHGNAVGLYFYDPEGNRIEVYWKSGLDAPQPFIVPIDLTADEEQVLRQLAESISDRAEADRQRDK